MNKECFCCGNSKPIEEFRQIAEQTHRICTYCETHRFCSYCGKDKPIGDFNKSRYRPLTICRECESWKDEHLKIEEGKIEVEYNGF